LIGGDDHNVLRGVVLPHHRHDLGVGVGRRCGKDSAEVVVTGRRRGNDVAAAIENDGRPRGGDERRGLQLRD
jgi:hypothetical protein